MSKHTPGPWEADDGDSGLYGVFAPDGHAIAYLAEPGHRPHRAGAPWLRCEDAANAQLIAAAPDAYDVTVALDEFADEIGSPAWNRLVKMARQARAKAEGSR